MDSSLCVQQYIQQLIAADASNMGRLLKVPTNTEALVWQYEHIRYVCVSVIAVESACICPQAMLTACFVSFRQFLLQCNHLIAMIADVCTVEKCPEMEADGQASVCVFA